MANGHGGAREGAGRPPVNLRARAGWRTGPDGTQVEVSVIDVIVETIRSAGFVKDAAARVGHDVTTLRDWRTRGARCLSDIHAGRRRRSEMSQHDKNCMTLALRMDEAEAEARVGLMATGLKVAHGGLKRTETTTRTDAAGQVTEVVTREIVAGPDAAMLGWMLSHRWPGDFGSTSRVEVTGADGGAITVDAAPLVDQIKAKVAALRGSRAESTPEALEAALAGPASTNGNGANGHHP